MTIQMLLHPPNGTFGSVALIDEYRKNTPGATSATSSNFIWGMFGLSAFGFSSAARTASTNAPATAAGNRTRLSMAAAREEERSGLLLGGRGSRRAVRGPARREPRPPKKLAASVSRRGERFKRKRTNPAGSGRRG